MPFLLIGNASEIEPLTESKALQLIKDAHDIEYSCLDGRFQWFYGGLDYNSISETKLPYLAPDTVSRYGLVKDGINPKSVKELITKTFMVDLLRFFSVSIALYRSFTSEVLTVRMSFGPSVFST